MCKGKVQSPIDISDFEFSPELKPLSLIGYSSDDDDDGEQTFTMENNGISSE